VGAGPHGSGRCVRGRLSRGSPPRRRARAGARARCRLRPLRDRGDWRRASARGPGRPREGGVRPMTEPPVFAAEVREAVAARRPLVALETTLVTHGLPAPEGPGTGRGRAGAG